MGEDLARDQRIALRLSELAPSVMFVVSTDGMITWVSESVRTFFRMEREAFIGTNIFDYVDMDWNADAIDSVVYAMGAAGLQRPMLFRLVHPDGTKIVAEVTANAQLDDPDIAGLAVYARPWDERWYFDRILDAMAEDAALTDVLHLVVGLAETENLAAQSVLIYTDPQTGERATRGHLDLGIAQRLAAPREGTPWVLAMRDNEPCSVRVDELPEPLAAEAHARGQRWCWAWPIPALDGSGAIGVLVLWRTLDEPPDHTCRMLLRRLVQFVALLFRRESLRLALLHAALHDPLTELGNRAKFFTELGRAIDHTPAVSAVGLKVGVISIDLDGFKPVNDRLGHAAGDDVLCVVADRLRAQVRTGDVVARLGGDEFCVLCKEVSSPDDVANLAQRIVTAMGEPITTRAGVVTISASVGVATCTPGSTDGDALLEAADQAMYQAKGDGSNRWHEGTITKSSE